MTGMLAATAIAMPGILNVGLLRFCFESCHSGHDPNLVVHARKQKRSKADILRAGSATAWASIGGALNRYWGQRADSC
jgi:hypothetical protein